MMETMLTQARAHRAESPGRSPQAKPRTAPKRRQPAEHELGRVAASRAPVQCCHGRLGAECSACRRKRIATSSRGSGSAAAPRAPRVGDVPQITKSTGSPLPAPVRARAEVLFGTGLGDVEIHDGHHAAEASRDLGARAFTVENRIFFGSGHYQPGTDHGLELLGHELAHVVQQRSGLVESEVKGVGDRYEQEAEVAGAAFVRGQRVQLSSAPGPLPQGQVQMSEDPGADAARVGTEESPFGMRFLGEANTPDELRALMAELAQVEGVPKLALLKESVLSGAQRGGGEAVASSASVQRAEESPPVQRAEETPLIQRAIVAGCNVPGMPANVIGMAAHEQIELACEGTAPGCQGEFPIPGDGRADLVRQRIPALPEIGEIKPASWLGRGLTAIAQAQLAGYLTAFYTAFPGVPPVPMWSYKYPPMPFIANPSQVLVAWGPSAGIYYYSCVTRPRVRVPERERVRVPVPVRVPETSPETSGETAREVGKGVAATGAAVGIGYLIYRGVRFLPSLLPPLWWTIPENVVIP
jgi:hypothetical protein